MGKFDGILICSDLDGTLRNSRGEISKENIDAINYFTANGGHFSLSTGRSPQYAKKLENEGVVCNAPVIVINGAMIYDIKKEKILYENPIEFKRIESMGEFSKKYEKYCSEINFFSKETVQRFDDIIDNTLYKVVFSCKETDGAAQLRKSLEEQYCDGFYVVNSWHTGVEILDEKSTKGECVKRIRDFCDMPIEKIVCVGDFENDISMLEAADLSYAVQNAIPQVKEAAMKVTVSNDENAIAAIIEDLE